MQFSISNLGIWFFHPSFKLHLRCTAASRSLVTTAAASKPQAVAVTEQLAACSGLYRTSRLTFVSIQRHHPCFPPVISADICHKV